MTEASSPAGKPASQRGTRSVRAWCQACAPSRAPHRCTRPRQQAASPVATPPLAEFDDALWEDFTQRNRALQMGLRPLNNWVHGERKVAAKARGSCRLASLCAVLWPAQKKSTPLPPAAPYIFSPLQPDCQPALGAELEREWSLRGEAAEAALLPLLVAPPGAPAALGGAAAVRLRDLLASFGGVEQPRVLQACWALLVHTIERWACRGREGRAFAEAAGGARKGGPASERSLSCPDLRRPAATAVPAASPRPASAHSSLLKPPLAGSPWRLCPRCWPCCAAS